MTKLQIAIIALASLLFMGLYWGADLKPEKQDSIERNRSLSAEVTDPATLVREAKSALASEQALSLDLLEQEMENVHEELAQIEILKKLSGNWYNLGRADISGIYAEQIAEKTNTEEAWSIAATTYTIGARQAKENKAKQFCFGRAVKAYENAISMNPSNVNHKVNLALCYTDNPPQDNPMKGILMLRDLNQAEPENVLVLTSLGRLAIQTGQYAKAVERLSKAVEVSPEDKQANCLLSDAYRGLGDAQKAAIYQQKCN